MYTTEVPSDDMFIQQFDIVYCFSAIAPRQRHELTVVLRPGHAITATFAAVKCAFAAFAAFAAEGHQGASNMH